MSFLFKSHLMIGGIWIGSVHSIKEFVQSFILNNCSSWTYSYAFWLTIFVLRRRPFLFLVNPSTGVAHLGCQSHNNVSSSNSTQFISKLLKAKKSTSIEKTVS